MSGQESTNGSSKKNLLKRALKGPYRRHKRYRTESLLIDNPVAGKVVNVGQAGFAIETATGLAVGESYLFKLRLGEKKMRLPGRIQWCRLTTGSQLADGEAQPVYRAGVSLAETVMSKAWQEALKRLTAEEPAHLIWHRAKVKDSSSNPLTALTVEAVQEQPAG